MRRKLNTILLIEDCEADNYLHKKVIEGLGAAEHTKVIRSGQEALGYLQGVTSEGEQPPELIFLDINTPGMEGWEFIEEYEGNEQLARSNSVLVMLSGSLNPDDRLKAEQSKSIRSYVQKPLTRVKLIRLLAEMP